MGVALPQTCVFDTQVVDEILFLVHAADGSPARLSKEETCSSDHCPLLSDSLLLSSILTGLYVVVNAGYSDRIPAVFSDFDGEAFAAFGGFLPVSHRNRVYTSCIVHTT